MSLNITSIANQYPDYAGYFMKAYELGTSTPKAIYFDDRKLSGTVRLKLDKDGFAISDGGAKVIPHIEGYYDIYFFKTKKEADENDFTNAISLGDRLIAEISGENITKASETKYGSIRFAKDNELFIGGEFPDSVAVESSKITRMGEISAEEQKAVEADLIARDDTKWLSPNDINYMITNFGAPNQEREQLKIGDTIWMDIETAKTRDDLLPQNNELFDPVEYPLLAAKSGYSQEGSTTVDGFSNPVQTSYFDTGRSSGSMLYIRISENLIYGMITEDLVDAGAYNVFKSTDNMNTIQVLPQSQTGAHSRTTNLLTMTWDGGDYILVSGTDSTVSVFQISTETFTSLNVNMFSGSPSISGTGFIRHYNENLGKFIMFQNRDDQNVLYVVEFENNPTNRTATNVSATGLNFDFGSGIKTPYEISYYNGKYYIFDMNNKALYSITEGDWVLTLEDTFTPTLSTTYGSGQSSTLKPLINKDGKLAFILSWNDSTKQVEIVYSDDLSNYNTSILQLNTTSPVIADNLSINPLFDFWIITGFGYDTITTKDFSTILYEKNDWNANGSSNYMFYDFDESTNKLKQFTSGSPTLTNNPIYLQELDAQVTVTVGEARTLDMGYEAIGNIIPLVKAK